MANIEQPNNETNHGKIKKIIESAEKDITQVYLDTKHTWVEAVQDDLYGIKLAMETKEAKEELGEKYNNAMEKLNELNNKVKLLKEQFPEKANIPPEETKKEILEMLKNIIE